MGESEIALKVENLSKQYRLGNVGTGTISHDLNRWWASIRGKEDPYLKIGESNDRSTSSDSEYVWSLKDINFEVKKGEVLGVIGKNGAGKSTLLKILSKVTGPTTGRIMSKGRIGALLEVGTGFHPELTGRENIFINGAILGMKKHEIVSKLDEIIDFSGCARYVDTPVKRYSSGMKVRLAFAVAAFLEPEILIVDEVLAVGDAEFQQKAIGKMQDVSKGEGRTVLFVSHNMGSISDLCTRCVMLENGALVNSGSVESVIDYYLTSQEFEDNVSLGSFRTKESLGKEVEIIRIELNKNTAYGSNLIAEVYLKNHLSLKLENLKLGIGVFTIREERVLFSVPTESFSIYPRETKRVRLTLNTGKHLMPGRYKLAFPLYQGNLGQSHKDVDNIKGYPTIEVLVKGKEGYKEAVHWNDHLPRVVFDLKISSL